MENSQLKNILFELVRLGIGNASMFSFPKDIDWNSIETIAKQQELLGVLVDGVQKLPQSNRPPQIIWLRWIGEVMQGYEQRYVLYKKAVADLGAWYHLHGYRMMLLKGLACGINWPKPEHRPYGDIDIYLFGQYKEADALMVQEFKEQGFKVDNSHHHHTVFEWQGFTVENHYDFVNIHHHKSNVELEKLFKELSVDDSNSIDLGGVQAYLPSANLNALFLIKHLVSHFASDKITLRQLLDWAFFVDKHHAEIDWNWLVEVLRKYHMKEFFDCMNAISVEDLEFDSSIFPYIQFDSVTKERILNEILNPEFSESQPKHIWKCIPFKYRRWKANEWKHELCYNESMSSSFWSGVKNHLMKPASI